MKKLLYSLCFVGLILSISCNDDSFCIDSVSVDLVNVEGDQVSFTLPNGQTYIGNGVPAMKVQLGDYRGDWQLVITSEVVTETGAIFEMINYFTDDEGNSFWSDDTLVLTGTGELGKSTGNLIINFVEGRRDFKCVNGDLKMDVSADAIQGKIDLSLSGNVCGGCE